MKKLAIIISVLISWTFIIYAENSYEIVSPTLLGKGNNFQFGGQVCFQLITGDSIASLQNNLTISFTNSKSKSIFLDYQLLENNIITLFLSRKSIENKNQISDFLFSDYIGKQKLIIVRPSTEDSTKQEILCAEDIYIGAAIPEVNYDTIMRDYHLYVGDDYTNIDIYGENIDCIDEYSSTDSIKILRHSLISNNHIILQIHTDQIIQKEIIIDGKYQKQNDFKRALVDSEVVIKINFTSEKRPEEYITISPGRLFKDQCELPIQFTIFFSDSLPKGSIIESVKMNLRDTLEECKNIITFISKIDSIQLGLNRILIKVKIADKYKSYYGDIYILDNINNTYISNNADTMKFDVVRDNKLVVFVKQDNAILAINDLELALNDAELEKKMADIKSVQFKDGIEYTITLDTSGIKTGLYNFRLKRTDSNEIDSYYTPKNSSFQIIANSKPIPLQKLISYKFINNKDSVDIPSDINKPIIWKLHDDILIILKIPDEYRNWREQYICMKATLYDEKDREICQEIYIPYNKENNNNCLLSNDTFTWNLRADAFKDQIKTFMKIKIEIAYNRNQYKSDIKYNEPYVRDILTRGTIFIDDIVSTITIPPGLIIYNPYSSIGDAQVCPLNVGYGLKWQRHYSRNNRLWPFSAGIYLLGLNVAGTNENSTNSEGEERNENQLINKSDLATLILFEVSFLNVDKNVYTPFQFGAGWRLGSDDYSPSKLFMTIGLGVSIATK
jgi:hypothetical protein